MNHLSSRPEEVFVFVGDGQGVPGLPHELTRAEAQQLGVEQLLDDALANGNYKVKGRIRTLNKIQYGRDNQGTPVEATVRKADEANAAQGEAPEAFVPTAKGRATKKE